MMDRVELIRAAGVLEYSDRMVLSGCSDKF